MSTTCRNMPHRPKPPNPKRTSLWKQPCSKPLRSRRSPLRPKPEVRRRGWQSTGRISPDAAFRAWILNPANLNGAGQDGTLTEDELQAVTAMDVSNQGIASLKGIEYFTNLESLNCRGNQLTQLDVNANRQLKNLTPRPIG